MACPWRLDGGLPPLGAGVGMGEGECEGEVTRGFVGGVGSEAFCGSCGTLFAMAGEPPGFMEPNVMLARLWCPCAPPFGI